MSTSAITPFVPQNLEQADKLAQQLSKSALLPDSLRGKPGDVLVMLITGTELGLSPMQAIRGLHVIKGKAVMSADLQVALTKRHPECIFFRMVESTALRAVYETHRKGEPQPTRMTFTMEDASRAGLGGDNWRKYPAAMCRARCASALARAVFPDLMLGVFEEDEAIAFGHKPERDLNPLQMDAASSEPAKEEVIAEGQVIEGAKVAQPQASAKTVRAKPEPKADETELAALKLRRLMLWKAAEKLGATKENFGQWTAQCLGAVKESKDLTLPDVVRLETELQNGFALVPEPPEQEEPPMPTEEPAPPPPSEPAADEYINTPTMRFHALGGEFRLSSTQLQTRAMTILGKTAGFTHAEIDKLHAAIKVVGK
jgi:hypothetical protein